MLSNKDVQMGTHSKGAGGWLGIGLLVGVDLHNFPVMPCCLLSFTYYSVLISSWELQ